MFKRHLFFIVTLIVIASITYFTFIKDVGRIDISQWETFENIKHGYGFRYPPSVSQPKTDCHEPCPDEEGDNIHAYDKTGDIFFVDAQNPRKLWGIENQTRRINLDLRSFVEEIWKLNKEYTASGIVRTIISNQTAYKFSSQGYTDGVTEFVFLDEFLQGQRQTNIFISDPKGNKFIIHFPADNQTSQQILKTFTFL